MAVSNPNALHELMFNYEKSSMSRNIGGYLDHAGPTLIEIVAPSFEK